MAPARPPDPHLVLHPDLLRPSFGTRIRRYFLTGLVLAAPLAITASVTWWFVNLVDGWVKPLIPAQFWPDTYLPFPLPGFGVVFALVGLTLLGGAGLSFLIGIAGSWPLLSAKPAQALRSL